MQTRDKLSARIDNYITELEFPLEPKELYRPIEYMLEAGGKRLRPTVLLLSCDAYNKERVESSLSCAAAVEIFHNFTLLHDDIMDNADIRRGRSSVYKKWGQNIAILSGDVMVIFAYKQLQKAPAELLPEILKEFSKMAAEVCEGQQFDINFETRDDVSIEEYTNMIRLKTAVVFGSAAKIGGMIGGASEDDCNALYDFGVELGLAFQLQDDYLDTYGTEEILGKMVGGDIEESKKTFLAITALNEAGDATGRALISTFADEKLPLSQKINRVKTIYDSLDIPTITLNTINNHLDSAKKHLDKLSIDQAQRAPLKELVQSLANRSK